MGRKQNDDVTEVWIRNKNSGRLLYLFQVNNHNFLFSFFSQDIISTSMSKSKSHKFFPFFSQQKSYFITHMLTQNYTHFLNNIFLLFLFMNINIFLFLFISKFLFRIFQTITQIRETHRHTLFEINSLNWVRLFFKLNRTEGGWNL